MPEPIDGPRRGPFGRNVHGAAPGDAEKREAHPMTQPIEPTLSESFRQELQTRHPDLADEIQGAIETLRKFQEITGTVAPDRAAGSAGHAADPSATIDIAPGAEMPARGAGKGTARRHTGDVPALTACESFGRYQIVRTLGQGAMGAVYLAYDSELERHVALKTPFLGDNPNIIARFYREARATAQIRSPYICPIYDVGQIGDIYYLTMAFIDGQSLERAMSSAPWQDQTAICGVIKKIARGLQKAHDLGIVHRDLKPDNIMIDGDSEPIVMDFGVARRVDDDVNLTTPGRLIGTPAYMSPEQVEADPSKIGPASDIYSLGVVLYVMLTGRLPFTGTLTSVLKKIGAEMPPCPSALKPEIGADSCLEKICLKMMAKLPSDRFASMANVADALEQAFGRATASAPASPPRRGRWSWLFGPFASLTKAVAPAEQPKPSSAASAPPPTIQATIDE